jgi:membrane protease YdiL (CAAX protease family)
VTYYAGFWRRISAAAIDNGIWLILSTWVFGSFPESFYDDHPEATGVLVLVFFTLWFNYFAFCEWRWGQTLGKNWTKIKVVSEDGSDLTWGQASLRNLLRLVDLIVIGFLLIAFADTRQRLGDRAGKTIVVPPPPAPATQVGEGSAKPPPAATAAAALASAPPPDPATIVPVSPAPATTGDAAGAVPGDGLPQITWSLRQTLSWFFGGFLIAVFSSLLVAPFDPDLESDAAFLVAQGLFGASLLTVAIGVASQWDRGRVREGLGRLGMRRFKPSALGWALLAWFGYIVVAVIFASLVLQPEQEDVSGELGVGDENLLVAITAILLIVVLAPVSEELFFRGFLFSGLRARFSLWPAVIASGLLFGLVHAPSGITTVPLLAVLGGLLAWFYAWNGSLWPCIFIHMLNNGIALAALGASDDGLILPPF